MTFGPYYVNDKPTAGVGITVQWEGGGDVPLDGDTATARLTYPDGHTTTLDAYINDGSLVINWPATSPFTMPGAYVLQARLTSTSGTQTVSPIGFVVLDAIGNQSAWANVGDVKAITGRDVTEQIIQQAQTQIEVLTRVLSSQAYLYGQAPKTGQVISLGAGDSQLLKIAVSYQSAWVAAQPDLFERSDVTSVNQDGMSASYTGTGLTLSPHAKQAVKRLSWMGSRSVSMTPARFSSPNMVDMIDDSLAWRRL
jgi:hypothetical protein